MVLRGARVECNQASILKHKALPMPENTFPGFAFVFIRQHSSPLAWLEADKVARGETQEDGGCLKEGVCWNPSPI